MAYNPNAPADDQFLADFPAEQREQQRALKDDQIVDASKLRGMVPGNNSGNIPVSNGNKCTNLNADLLDGHDSTYFSADGHGHSVASYSSNGFMSNTDKQKLDGIDAGAETNQNAFANVKAGTVTIQADGKQDTLVLEAGSNIIISLDAANDKVTVGFSGVLPIANGGTGSSTEKYLPLTGGTLTGNLRGQLDANSNYRDLDVLNPADNNRVGIIRFQADTANSKNMLSLNGTRYGTNTICNLLAGACDASGNVTLKSGSRVVCVFTGDGKLEFPDGTQMWVE